VNSPQISSGIAEPLLSQMIYFALLLFISRETKDNPSEMNFSIEIIQAQSGHYLSILLLISGIE
jgi:hypothetical protein